MTHSLGTLVARGDDRYAPLDHGVSHVDLDVLQQIALATTADACNDALWRALQRFGADTFAAGEVDLKLRHRVVFYAMRWSDSWRRFYLAHLLQRDPLLSMLEQAKGPLTWTEWRSRKTLTAEEKATFKLVSQHGWIDGFAFPAPRHGSHIGLVSIVCTSELNPRTDGPFLTCAASIYLERIRSVVRPGDFPVAPLGLAPRELECLELVARGFGDRQIAKKLNISTTTAHEHVQRAMRRIGVGSRAEAAAIAIAFGAIRL